MNNLTNGSLGRKPLRGSSAFSGKQDHRKPESMHFEVSAKQNFTKYFFNEDKECQTPHISANQMEFDDFLKSHRSSIEKEVTLIFKGNRVKAEQNLGEKKIHTATCEVSLKDLINYAKKHQSVSPASKITPMSINKARLNAKTPVIPCNGYELGLKNSKIFSSLSPKAYGRRLHNLVESNNYKSVRSKGPEHQKILHKANHRVQYSKRPSTPVSVFKVHLSIKPTISGKHQGILENRPKIQSDQKL